MHEEYDIGFGVSAIREAVLDSYFSPQGDRSQESGDRRQKEDEEVEGVEEVEEVEEDRSQEAGGQISAELVLVLVWETIAKIWYG